VVPERKIKSADTKVGCGTFNHRYRWQASSKTSERPPGAVVGWRTVRLPVVADHIIH